MATSHPASLSGVAVSGAAAVVHPAAFAVAATPTLTPTATATATVATETKETKEEKTEAKTPEGFARLNTGALMPLVGLGTWKAGVGEVGVAVTTALEAGYRHLDCAAVYGNEKEIGTALAAVWAKGVVKREDVFITSKLWCTNHAKEHVEPALRQTLADLQLSYLDLYLVHHPAAFQHTGIPSTNPRPVDPATGNPVFAKVTLEETWKAMEKLPATGLVRAIGVSNYKLPQLYDLWAYATIMPAVNQIELHPYLSRPTLVAQCRRWGIHVSAYSPLGSNTSGASGPLHNSVLASIATARSVTPAQVLLRWITQQGISVLPKSVRAERMRENAALGFTLDAGEVARIDGENKNQSFVSMVTYWKFDYYEA